MRTDGFTAMTASTFAELVRNLGDPYIDATAQMRDMLDRGRTLFAYGIFYPEGGDMTFEAKHLVFVGSPALVRQVYPDASQILGPHE